MGIAAVLVLTALPFAGCHEETTSPKPTLTPIEQLGKELFFDENLSSSGKMSCATCHDPDVGFTSPDAEVNAGGAVFPGAEEGRFGNRKPSSASYTGFSSVLYYDINKKSWIGGMFWDGRASGWTMSDPLAEQAQGPFLNPLEHNLKDAADVCSRVAASDYASLFKQVWGVDSLDMSDEKLMFDRVARSIAAYEHSAEVDRFDSKYDFYLKGQAVLTPQEMLGLDLFKNKAGCADCHPAEPASKSKRAVFTNYSYHNIGVPRNPANPFYIMPAEYNPDGIDWVDPGLGGFLKSEGYALEVYLPEMGKHKTPSLRNVDLRPEPGFVKAYTHNGYFKSLEEVVHFSNALDMEKVPPPEYPATVEKDIGGQGLTPNEEAAIVAFLKTLSDGWVPEK
jgi:cytochrome c peroxidase